MLDNMLRFFILLVTLFVLASVRSTLAADEAFSIEDLYQLIQQQNVRIELLETKVRLQEEMITGFNNKYEPLPRKYLHKRSSDELMAETMPTSCIDLLKFGHQLSGFYTVRGQQQLESVYCHMDAETEKGIQTWMGYVDVKSSPVYFSAQKSAGTFSSDATIVYDVMLTNVGGGMDPKTGIFKAPRSGIYSFSYTHHVREKTNTNAIILYKNDEPVTASWQNEMDTAATVSHAGVTLKLRANDEIRLVLLYGSIFDDAARYSNFVGVLHQEDLFS